MFEPMFLLSKSSGWEKILMVNKGSNSSVQIIKINLVILHAKSKTTTKVKVSVTAE